MTLTALLQYILVWLPLVLAGSFLMRWAWRGRRINDHPICRKCRFDLVGLAPNGSHPDRCPECGTDLTSPSRSRFTRRKRSAALDGERRKRWPALALGLLLLLSGLGTGFWLTYKPLAKFPWTTWMPDWVLAEMVDRPSTNRPGPVLRELRSRLNNRNVSTHAIDRAVKRILVVQADESRPWDNWLGYFVQRARKDTSVSDDAWRRYVTQSVRPTLLVRPGEGGDLFLEVVVTQRAARGHDRDIAIPFCGITQLDVPSIDSLELGIPSNLRAGIVPIDGDNRPITIYSRKITGPVSAGTHTVRNKVLLQFGDDPPGGRTGGSAGLGYASHESYSPSIGSVEVVLETTLVVPEGSPITMPVASSENRLPIREASLRIIQSGGANLPAYEMILDVLVSDDAASGAFRTSVRIEDHGVREEALAVLSFTPETRGKTLSLPFPIVLSEFHPLHPCATRLWRTKPETVKLILSPIEASGPQAAGISFVETSTERLVLDNVPVEYEQR